MLSICLLFITFNFIYFYLTQKLIYFINRLKKYVERDNSQADLVYVRLGDILAKTKNFADAMIYYHSALTINPNLEKAKHGIKTLEKQLNRLGTSEDSINLPITDEEDSLEINEVEIDDTGSLQEEDSFESFM